MAVNAGDTVHVAFRGMLFGQRIILGLNYFVNVGNATLTTNQVLDELNNEITGAGANGISASYLACLPATFTLQEVRSQVIKPTRSALRSLNLVGFVGTHIGAATVASDSAAVLRRTALAGRRQVSTLKVGPAPDSASAAGLLTAAYRGLLDTFGGDSIKPLNLPVSTVQMQSVILTPTGLHDGRFLVSFRSQETSRVNRRRTVGLGE